MIKIKKFLSLVLATIIMATICLPMGFSANSLDLSEKALVASNNYWTDHGVSEDQVVISFELVGGTFASPVWKYDCTDKTFYYIENYSDPIFELVPKNANDLKAGTTVKLPELYAPNGKDFIGWYCYSDIDSGLYKAGTIYAIPQGSGGQKIYFCAMFAPESYTMGDETYSFDNYSKCNCSNNGYGHCFGMAVTSSGYYLGILDKSFVGLTDNKPVYSLDKTQKVMEPICYYQKTQGKIVIESNVAGGSHYYGSSFNVKKDWSEIFSYVRGNKDELRGRMQLVYYQKTKKGNNVHGVNYLYWAIIDGEERLYIYDNNCPHVETYLYKNSKNDIYAQEIDCIYGCKTISGKIDGLAMIDMKSFLASVKSFKSELAVYAETDTIYVADASPYLMASNLEGDSYSMFEVEDGTETISITPLVDNATFTYMDKEYNFDKIDENTHAKITVPEKEGDSPEFEIFNIKPENCTCKCHGNFIQRIIFKITNFFQKLFGKNKVCACGVKH